MRPFGLVFAAMLAAGCSRGESLGEKHEAIKPATTAAERGIGDFAALSAERDWPWWRGPSRNGVAHTGARPPVKFGENENVLWKAEIPGRGHAAPTVVGERIYLATADEGAQVQSVLAIDRRTGKQLWKTDVSSGGFAPTIHPHNTHATPTVACDGERLLAVFIHNASVHATALDLDGKQLWQVVVGPFDPQQYKFGYGPSPLVYKNAFIIASEFDGESFLAALDRTTGSQLWKTPRPRTITFSSPVVAHLAGRDQLLISGANSVASYDPNNGEALWSTTATTAATCGTMVWDGDLVFASGGYPDNVTCAVRADGLGKVVWSNKEKHYEQSLLAYDGHVYGLTDSGVAHCWRAADGKEMWKARLKGQVSVSPVLAGGNIYQGCEAGTIYVYKATPDGFEQVAQNQLGDEAYASPAVAGNQMFWRVAKNDGGRRQEILYCIGTP
jgi:outer membrane protein assembly factor BamB